jgi:hypothetical protein
MQIEMPNALPTNFSVSVKMGKGSMSYHVSVVSGTKLKIKFQYSDGSFTSEEKKAGADFIRKSLADGSLHLPMFIPLSDVSGAEEWEGVGDAVGLYRP